MPRRFRHILPLSLALFAVACGSPTAPAPTRPVVTPPASGASFDDTQTPPDSTCRSGYNVGQGYSC